MRLSARIGLALVRRAHIRLSVPVSRALLQYRALTKSMGAVICKAAKDMRRFSVLLSSCPVSALSAALISCAGPMNDPLGKHIYQEWVAEAANPGLPNQGTPGGNAAATDAFIFRMKAVKDYEYYNYVTNLRRGTTWGEFGSDSVKIVLDSLVALTGGTETKAALGAASAGVTGATTSIKKNVLFDQSITTFITKMDTVRLNKWNDILCKMGRCKDHPPAQRYTVAEAFVDLEDYGHCGTLDAALRDVAVKTSEEQKKAKEANDKINRIPTLDQLLKK